MSKIAPHFLLLFALPIAIGSGMFVITDYSNRPGAQGNPTSSLDRITSFDLAAHGVDVSSNHSNLLLFYHPHCPCTVSTLHSLERLSKSFSRDLKIVAVAYCPTEESDDWISSPTTRVAEGLPNATLVIDRGGEMCRDFGVGTSGHVLLYDSHRELVFNGGITPGRGHEGDCPAATSLLQTLTEIDPASKTWPVYGCSILDDEVQPQ